MNWLKRHSNGVFVIAEAGINHNGDMRLVKALIDVAVEAKADAIKFQTFQTKNLLIKNAPKARYQRKTTNSKESQYNMLKRVELSKGQHLEIISYCKEKDIAFISTPFEEQSADLLEELDVPLFKIPSGEITNLRFLEHVARKSKPIIISTGMSFLSEVEKAVQIILKNGCHQVALLHCVSNYPASEKDANLKAMHTMKQAFQLPVGYSDHTIGVEVTLAAVALGAQIIEKHFTLDKNLPGPDHQASLEPGELKQLIKAIRRVEIALGDGLKKPATSEMENQATIRKSLFFKSSFAAGTKVTAEMIEAKRPAIGYPPERLVEILGQELTYDVERDTPVSWKILK